MTHPRTPETKEARLPDALDQNPGADPSRGQPGRAGSEDAELLAGAAKAEGDVEAGTGAEGPGQTND